MTEGPKSGPKNTANTLDLRLDGLLGELGRAVSEMVERLESGAGEVTREQSFDTGRGPVKAQAGIRIRMGGVEVQSDTAPSARRPTQPAAETPPSAPKPRDLTGTILEEDGIWSLSADLPGVSEEDLTLNAEDGQLIVTATARGRQYVGRFPFPEGLRTSDLTVSLRHGILDLTAPLSKGVAT